MSKFTLHKYGEGWEFAPEGIFSRKVIENRVVRKKFTEARHQEHLDLERSQTLTEELLEKYERAVLLDPLTRLYNSRTFFRRLSYELKRAKRYKRPLALLIMSIDRLGHYAHDYSVMIVDDIFKAVAAFVKEAVRDVDIPARCGQDHFAVIFPETYASRAVQVGERIREQLSSQPINEDLRNIRITVSVGVVSFPTHGREENELILKALDFHDIAQRQGGDRVHSHQ
jgi:diguanylate cyclase (GGDEF)-like protein